MKAFTHPICILIATAQFAVAEQSTPSARLAERAKSLLATMTETSYQHTTALDEKTNSLKCDCSGLVGYMLRNDFPWAYLSLDGKEAAWRSRPLSVTYHETFLRAGSSTTSPWIRIRKMTDARPGDILAWRKDEVVRGSSTGHTLVIASTPAIDPDGRIRVRVIDSTRKIHSEDTRPVGTDGVGAGVMWFLVNDSGEPIGFYVDESGKKGTSTKIAIGRLNPAFNPTHARGESAGEETDFLGLPLEDAGALAEKRNLTWRTITQDDETKPASLTIRNNRINFATKGGIVTLAKRG